MAMTGGIAKLVASGTPSGWPGPICLYAYYKEKSQSIENNTTTLSLGMYVTTPSSGWYFGSWTDYDGSYIGTATSGSNCKTFDGSCPAKTSGTRWLVEGQEITVSHANDGTKSATIYWKWGVSSSWAGILRPSGSFSVDLTTIPRTSEVTATDANIGSATTITINRASSGFTHTLGYSFGSLTGTIATKTDSTSIGWVVPTAFYAQIPDDPSGECTITCTTYSGSTAIGTDTTTFTATASKSACAPSVSVTAVDTNADVIALTGSNKRIVKGFSDVKVTTTATAKNSATISGISVTCGAVSKSGANVTFTGAESATIKATAKDSRGYPTEATATGLTLVNYIVPTIVESITRESPTSDVVNISVRGNWFNGSFGAVTNTLKVEVRYKPKNQASYEDSDEYVDMTVTTNGNTYTASVSLDTLSYTQAYRICFRVSEAVHIHEGPLADPVCRNTEISKGSPVFDWGENDFNFNVPVNFNGGMTIAPGDAASAIDGDGSSKTPLIYIVEQGVSGNWTYRKWSDGLAELWGHIVATHHNGSILGGELNYPFTLSGNIYGIGTLNSAGGNSGAALPWNLKLVYGTTLCGAWVHNSGSVGFGTASTADVSVHIMGRWK